MLDKNLPLKRVVMQLAPNHDLVLEKPQAAEGYSLRLYQPGDEHQWAEIETSVQEFNQPQHALLHFSEFFLPHRPLLPQRMVFACSPDQQLVATASAWFAPGDPSIPMLHWVATRPEHQKKGLGSAVVRQAVQISRQAYPGKPIYLFTQTWSYAAILMYHKFGFRLMKSTVIGNRVNEFPEASEILKQVYPKAIWHQLMEASVE